MKAFWRKKPKEKALNYVSEQSWWTRIFDWTPGAWQTHDAYDRAETSVLANPTVFACTTLTENDIGKLPFIAKTMSQKVWQRVEHPSLKLLKNPNKYQNQVQFRKNWIHSKQIFGNTYVLKIRNRVGEIIGLVILDPPMVKPLVSESGEVFYTLNTDSLRMVENEITVPASEIIHDRYNCLHHPLIGMSPLYAAAEAARIGNSIIKDSKGFFTSGAKPSGVLTAPGEISDETAQRLKEYFDNNFSGEKAGKTVVVGDGLKYEQMRMTSVDAQLIEQLGWSDEKICSVFHIPPYMVGVGPMPTYNNIEALSIQYYSQCLQDLIESMEECLNNGLSIQGRFKIELDLDGLFRMDQATLTKSLNDSVGGGWMAPDEARMRMNLPPVPGGKYPYLQQQNYSLEALAKRDADDPFAKPQPAPVAEESDEPPVDDESMKRLVIKGAQVQLREALLQ